jgi:hypothetical protein
MQVVNRVCATVDEVETGVAAGKGALHFACDASRHDKAVALAGQLQIVFHVVWRDDRVDAAVHSTDSGDVDVVRWLDDNVAGLRLRRSWSRSGCVSRPRCMLFPPVLLLSAAP